MKQQEAIKKVKEFGLHHAIGDLPNSALTVKAFEMAVEALEKQIPKKVIPTPKSDFYSFKCPVCQRHYAWCIRHPYCDCGQLLDWSDIQII